MGAPRITEKDVAAITAMSDAGMSYDKIAEITGKSKSTVTYTAQAYKAAMAGDAEGVKNAMRLAKSEGLIRMAVEQAGKRLEDFITPPAAPKIETPPQQGDNTAIAFATLIESIKEQNKAVDELNKTMKAMQLLLQGFRGEMGQKLDKIVETINLNADYINKDIEKAVDHLGGIKQNTKKGGYHQP